MDMYGKVVDVTVKGIRPLLQNQFTPEDSRKKGAPIYDDQEEASRRLICDEAGALCQPASHFEAALIAAGANYKLRGRKSYKDAIRAGVVVFPELIPHLVQGWRIDKRTVVLNKCRVMRCRPCLDEWELRFSIGIRDEAITPLTLKDILMSAGNFHGIGDYRPKFGLFEVIGFDVAA